MTRCRPLLPSAIAHCDWSKCAKKRWMTWARRRPDGDYDAEGPETVDDPYGLIRMLRDRESLGGTILLGFDFPIGLPEMYADAAGVIDFLELLRALGETEPWQQFYEIARTHQEIRLHRSFYPYCPGGTKRRHLLDGLRLAAFDDLRRSCEKATPGRRAACPLFWTLGAQQVGRAAISGWRDVLAPALREDDDRFLVWPFSGSLYELVQSGAVVAAETYPAEYYRHLGVTFGPVTGGKCSLQARRSNAKAVLASAAALRLHLSPELTESIRTGFPAEVGVDDGFDALIGLLGILKVVRGEFPSEAPDDEAVQSVEGWILGQAPSPEQQLPLVLE